jgi:hypothetical protein
MLQLQPGQVYNYTIFFISVSNLIKSLVSEHLLCPNNFDGTGILSKILISVLFSIGFCHVNVQFNGMKIFMKCHNNSENIATFAEVDITLSMQ